MIKRFMKVDKGLYRGSAPSISDVSKLKESFNINKIISLDQQTGQKINRVCKLQNITHIIIPIFGTDLTPIAKLMSQNLKSLLIDDGPTFVHCLEGKDRTGMVIAMYRCQYMGWSCSDAITEAESLGFGVGLNPKVKNFYKKIICHACSEQHDHANIKHIEDTNEADITDNMRDDQIDHDVNMPSLAPYLDFQSNQLSPYDNGPGLQGLEQVQFGKGFVTI